MPCLIEMNQHGFSSQVVALLSIALVIPQEMVQDGSDDRACSWLF